MKHRYSCKTCKVSFNRESGRCPVCLRISTVIDHTIEPAVSLPESLAESEPLVLFLRIVLPVFSLAPLVPLNIWASEVVLWDQSSHIWLGFIFGVLLYLQLVLGFSFKQKIFVGGMLTPKSVIKGHAISTVVAFGISALAFGVAFGSSFFLEPRVGTLWVVILSVIFFIVLLVLGSWLWASLYSGAGFSLRRFGEVMLRLGVVIILLLVLFGIVWFRSVNNRRKNPVIYFKPPSPELLEILDVSGRPVRSVKIFDKETGLFEVHIYCEELTLEKNLASLFPAVVQTVDTYRDAPQFGGVIKVFVPVGVDNPENRSRLSKAEALINQAVKGEVMWSGRSLQIILEFGDGGNF